MKLNIKSGGNLGVALHNFLLQHDFSVKEFSAAVEINTEYARKLIRGEGSPGLHLAKDIAKYMNVPPADVEDMLAKDKLSRTLKKKGYAAALHRPERADEFDALVGKLTNEEKDTVLDAIRKMLRARPR